MEVPYPPLNDPGHANTATPTNPPVRDTIRRPLTQTILAPDASEEDWRARLRAELAGLTRRGYSRPMTEEDRSTLEVERLLREIEPPRTSEPL